MRIVSLLPSATETVCALGMESALAGRSHECDYPPSVKSLPACTSAAIDPSGSSRKIDEEIKDLARRGLSIYQVDLEMVNRLAPDVIVTQAQCEVCAVSLNQLKEALKGRVRSQPRLISQCPARLKDLWEDIRVLAEEIGAAEAGKDLVKRLKVRVTNVIEKTCAIENRPSAACLEWIDPLMTAGHWTPELAALAGAECRLSAAGERSRRAAWEDLVQANPDVLLAMPCGFGLERTVKEVRRLGEKPEWKGLKAVRKGRVYAMDGNQYFNRPGPRLVDSLEILAEILHPKWFDFGHQGRGWRRLGG